MADEPPPASRDDDPLIGPSRTDHKALEDRFAKLERVHARLVLLAWVVPIVLTLLTGLTWLTIPSRARVAAEGRAEKIAMDWMEEQGFVALKTAAERHAEAAKAAETAAQAAVTRLNAADARVVRLETQQPRVVGHLELKAADNETPVPQHYDKDWQPVPLDAQKTNVAPTPMELTFQVASTDEVYLISYSYVVQLQPDDTNLTRVSTSSRIRLEGVDSDEEMFFRGDGDSFATIRATGGFSGERGFSGSVVVEKLPRGTYRLYLEDYKDNPGARFFRNSRHLTVYRIR